MNPPHQHFREHDSSSQLLQVCSSPGMPALKASSSRRQQRWFLPEQRAEHSRWKELAPSNRLLVTRVNTGETVERWEPGH